MRTEEITDFEKGNRVFSGRISRIARNNKSLWEYIKGQLRIIPADCDGKVERRLFFRRQNICTLRVSGAGAGAAVAHDRLVTLIKTRTTHKHSQHSHTLSLLTPLRGFCRALLEVEYSCCWSIENAVSIQLRILIDNLISLEIWHYFGPSSIFGYWWL